MKEIKVIVPDNTDIMSLTLFSTIEMFSGISVSGAVRIEDLNKVNEIEYDGKNWIERKIENE